MSVRALRHDKQCGWFSKFRGLSASVFRNSTETLAMQAINLTILLAHFLPLIDVLFLFALVRFLGSPRTAKRYNSRLNQLLSG